MRRGSRFVFAASLAIAILLQCAIAPNLVLAHPLSPALLEVQEYHDGRAEVRWKTSLLRLPGSRVHPSLPTHCRTLTSPIRTEELASLSTRWTVDCTPQGLVGQRIGVEGLSGAKIDALLRVTLADGRLVQRVVRSGQPFLRVPERESALDVTRDFIGLGFRHILTGSDHLLFVFGLLILVSGARLLVQTITAFTVGHSMTLSLAVLGFANVPSGAVEVGIALSIFLLAVELARPETAPATPLRRFPWAMAVLFGLLHGLGFAGALSEIGLPMGEIPLALFSFNLGIEVGQLLFAAVVLIARSMLMTRWTQRPAWAAWLPIYAMGSLATFWCLEQTSALFFAAH
jgi:hydrogenase/urease accessory protein HupE